MLLDDVFALHVKTASFRECVANPHFRDYARLLQEQADQIFAMTHGIAGRICTLGGTTTHSLRGFVREIQPIRGKTPDMLRELREDNAALIKRMLQIHDFCDDIDDLETADLLPLKLAPMPQARWNTTVIASTDWTKPSPRSSRRNLPVWWADIRKTSGDGWSVLIWNLELGLVNDDDAAFRTMGIAGANERLSPASASGQVTGTCPVITLGGQRKTDYRVMVLVSSSYQKWAAAATTD